MKTTAFASRSARKDRLLHEDLHNPYDTGQKPPKTTVCPVCRVVFQDGHWRWADSWPLEAHLELCEACRRIKDNRPAGEVTIQGEAAMRDRTEIINLARNLEKLEAAEHPLHRIVKVIERHDTVVITTTDRHLARRIGEAMRHARKNRLEWHYDTDDRFVRVRCTSGP